MTPFWTSTRDLLRYRRTLVMSIFAAGVYAAGFGAGISMLVPMVALFFDRDAVASGEHPVRALLNRSAEDGRISEAWADQIGGALPDDPWLTLVMILAGIGVVSVIANIGRYIHQYLTITVVGHLAMDYRSRVFRKILDAPLTRFQGRDASDTASRIVVDTGHLARGHEAILGRAVLEVFKGVAALLVALVLSWKLALIFFVAAFFIGVVLAKIGRIIRRATKRALQKQGVMLKLLTATLNALPVIKTHNANGYERRTFKATNRALYEQEMVMRRAKAFASPVTDVLGYLGVASAASAAGYMVFRAGVAPETLVGVLGALGAAASSFKPLSGLNNQIKAADAAAARVLDALAEPVEPIGYEDRKDCPKLPPHRASIAFEGVGYLYPVNESEGNTPAQADTPAALTDIALQVAHGQTVAIVGTNGAGKSTLLSLLPRLILPSSGRILIDGQDIAEVNLRGLRDQIAVVSQHSVLFEGTIADNIAYARPVTTEAQVIDAAQAAGAHAFIAALPDGYQHRLGETGSGLSGGQKQRLCIARAILRDPSILILDEATSQIDAESEAQIATALKTLRAGRTTFIIAHRLSTVIDADCIVVMDQGRIVDQGTHQELLERCTLYQSLVRNQLG